MEVMEEEVMEELKEQNDENVEEREGETHEEPLIESHVSMHALAGVHDFRTMRITGNYNGQSLHVLIDTGSTHNFLDFETEKLGCKLEPTTPFPMAVADGNKIYKSYVCKEFVWRMQGTLFTTDMLTLPLGGCDAVLGIR
ncbi:hypothetical protein BUALT_Bualt07G0110300 [Buddleja alternifolia]|uniref:Uncharacterized protein n=1 Tax=Buddleja alternifolia TaxID=168488 RepID=A0AAV6XKM3_9LAMI|nr:hypothetical protein BUALT_Bualt07G0110300 [Buddleja alternifolia]